MADSAYMVLHQAYDAECYCSESCHSRYTYRPREYPAMHADQIYYAMHWVRMHQVYALSHIFILGY